MGSLRENFVIGIFVVLIVELLGVIVLGLDPVLTLACGILGVLGSQIFFPVKMKRSPNEAPCYWCGLVESKVDMKTCEEEYFCKECFDEVKDRCKS